MTLDQFREYADFFKELLADNPVIKWSIILAGIGGFLDGVHVLYLFWQHVK